MRPIVAHAADHVGVGRAGPRLPADPALGVAPAEPFAPGGHMDRAEVEHRHARHDLGDLGDEASGLRQERLGRPHDLGQVAAHAGAQRAL
jgi:hypothetical protein